MTSNQILPVNNTPTSSGQGTKANGIVQIQQPQQTGAWILADNGTLYMNGTLVPSGGFQLNNIKADDLLCGVMCNNGGDLQLGSDSFIVLQAQSSVTINTGIQSLVLNDFTINGSQSSQQFIVYGQSKGEAMMSEQYHVHFPDPEIGQPDFNLRMFGYTNIQEWFDNDQYNRPNNAFIEEFGSNFRYVCPPNTMVDVEITFQLRYTFDGSTNPTCYLCCGLFNVDQNQIVPQSLNWQQMNDTKFKWVTFKTNFTMRTDNDQYFPFFYNQNHDQLSDTETGGLQRSSIKFKFYQFVMY